MSIEKRSKRQERRKNMKKQEARGRRFMIGLISLGAALLVFAFVWPSIRPIADIVSVESGTYPNANDNTMGDPNAPIMIEEFADFQCPYCEQFHKETEPLLKQYYIDTGKVLYTYRSMGNWVSDNIARAVATKANTESQDSAAIANTESQDSALAAYCAGVQNKFWQMHALLFANVIGEGAGSFTDRRLKAIAKKVDGLDVRQFNSCYNSGTYADRVQQDLQDAQAAGITGTPGFLITYTVNGETKTDRIDGAQPFSTFQQKLEAALNEMGVQ